MERDLKAQTGMESSEVHTSPDGMLRLMVVRKHGDIDIGFDGCSWHTHGDVLVGDYALRGETGLTPETAVKRLVADIVQNRAIIALSRVGDRLQDIWVTDSPDDELRRASANESVECRYWNGDPWIAPRKR